MRGIEVAVIHEAHESPGGMMMFLAKLTQRGHALNNLEDVKKLYDKSVGNYREQTVKRVAALPHGTIKRFAPITIAIVGASRRFLAQARTHSVGMNFMSASLQYSDYSDKGNFVIPYEAIEIDSLSPEGTPITDKYIASCEASMKEYKELAKVIGNDAAGYAAPQGLRNILIIQANAEAWLNFIRARSCSRNTTETQYVATLIWQELLKTTDGKEMFYYAGPDCMWGKCREGKMTCGVPLKYFRKFDNPATAIIEDKWPLLNKEDEDEVSSKETDES